MVNWIWLFFIIVGFLFAAVNGRIDLVTEALFEGAKSGVTVCFGLISILVFWLGMMRIAEQSGLLEKLAIVLRPVVKYLIPRCAEGSSCNRIYSIEYECEHSRFR